MIKNCKRIAILILCIATLCALVLALSSCSAANYETNEHKIDDAFSSISISSSTAEITLAPATDGKCSVVCFEDEKRAHSVDVYQGVLAIYEEDNREWYEYIGINLNKTTITVYLPEAQYSVLTIDSSTGDVKIPDDFSFASVDITLSTGKVDYRASTQEATRIVTSTGDITVEGISAGSLDLTVSTGRVTVTDVVCLGDIKVDVSTGGTSLSGVECINLLSDGSTGAVSLKDVVASESFIIERSTGAVRLDSADADEIYIQTTTGSVEGTLKSGKAFSASTNTGKTEVPKDSDGGICEITTTTGDIKISIEK